MALSLSIAAQWGAEAAVLSAGGFTTSATAPTSAVAPGGSVSLSAVVTSSTVTTVLVDLEIFNPSGQKVGQWYWDNQAFAAGQQRSYSATWQVPPGAPGGSYKVRVGVFSSGWGSLRHWNDTAGSFSVQTSGTAPTPTKTPTTTAPSPTPTKTPTGSTPTRTPTSPPSSGTCLGAPAYPEIRTANITANRTAGQPLDPAYRSRVWKFEPYYDKVNGQGCTGTTEQILEWAARKWRFHEVGYADLAKAMAVHESWWKQSQQGNCTSGVCESFGILQVRITTWRGGDTLVKSSTAMNADYSMAILRFLYDGNSWLGSSAAGIRNAVGAYQCGCGNAGSSSYVNTVFGYLQSKPWKAPGQPPYYF